MPIALAEATNDCVFWQELNLGWESVAFITEPWNSP